MIPDFLLVILASNILCWYPQAGSGSASYRKRVMISLTTPLLLHEPGKHTLLASPSSNLAA